MLVSSASFAAAAVAIIGLLIFWSNPRRIMNRFFLSFSLHLMSWLICVHQGVSLGEDPRWVRLASAIGAFVPVHMWLVKAACIGYSGREILRRIIWWVIAAAALMILCYTQWYVMPGAKGGARFGVGYGVYMVVFIGMFSLLCRETVLQIRAQSGLSRLELQILLLGGSAMCFGIIFLMALRAVIHAIWPIHLQPFVVLLFYAGTVVAITTHRIFDARQIVLVGLQKISLVSVVAGVAYLLDEALAKLLPEPFALAVTTALALWFASTLNGWLNSVFQFYPQATAARQAAFAVARRESRLENLEPAFLGILKGWGQTDHALLISGGKEALRGGNVDLPGDSVEVSALRQLRWVTPERLAREKATPERVALAQFLGKHRLGVLVIGEGPTLTAFIGAGIAASRRPYTYPQVTQLMELASIIESALERAHFSVKAQHAEQLATVGLLGASLAHEIRNPLVSIKTFVQLLPTHHQDPAFRAKFFTLISDEVSRIDRLTEQLLDLASPRAYVAEVIELHPVLRASLDLVAVKAADKRIQFLTDFQATSDRAFTDASAAKQVLLNLCFNAIQAVETRPGDRWVKVSTRNVSSGLEMIVEDSGPGIAPEIRSRLFQPFHSTKSTGFGLGLAICSDILSGLNATIAVDSSAPGQGAVFRVTFPCPVLSS
jgi:signal transduction histidine kinase